MIKNEFIVPAFKQALPSDVLMSVEQPARYLGNEVNAVNKTFEEADITFCMCFPDVYEIGMSHLGIQILYDMFNRWDGVYCDRVYSPWTDLDKIMRERGLKLFGVESQEPIKKFDFLGITLQYEMCYTNILQVLELSGIPLRSADRTVDDPFVIGGGPCTYNPEPIAPFFDLFYMGEGETQYEALLKLYGEWKKNKRTREEFLRAAAKIPGIYVPSLYEVCYNEDGTLKAMNPIYEDVPKKVRKEIVLDMTSAVYPEKPLVPHIRAVQDRVVLEIQRGCIRGCRFCQAGMVYRPVRERDVKRLKELALTMIKNTGYDEISLSSLSSSDYSQLPEIINYLIDECNKRKINISLPSLRIDAFSLDVMRKVQDVKKISLTFAPEAGTQRMRDVINKGLTEESIMNGARMAFAAGWSHVKLYFMLGLPTETEEDMKGIPELAERMAEAYYEISKDKRNGKCQITMSTSFFVPKPFTPFQWAVMYQPEEYLNRARIVNRTMKEQHNQKSLKYNWHEAYVTVLEGVLARGDRRVADVIETAYKNGALYDAWGETFHYDIWTKAFEKCGLSIDFYNTRERSLDELLPWDFIDTGVTKAFLKHEWEKAKQAKITPNCRQSCSGCGVKRLGGGVCFENQNTVC